MPRRKTARRLELLEALMREARRTGSTGALHARAIGERMGVNSTDFECLDVLDWTGPITAGELARRVGITSGAITGAIDRLERAGLVRRAADPNDRRRVIVEIPPPDPGGASAQRLADAAAFFQPLLDDTDAINDRFDDDQLAAVLEWLRLSNDAVERSTERLRNK
jgi:DNA-binding MarR family transcriptional regulator